MFDIVAAAAAAAAVPQMHVHLAQVDTTLVKAIVDGFNAPSSHFYVDCSLSGNSHGKSRLEGCKFSASQCTNCPEVSGMYHAGFILGVVLMKQASADA
jgi:hypothetical protein